MRKENFKEAWITLNMLKFSYDGAQRLASFIEGGAKIYHVMVDLTQPVRAMQLAGKIWKICTWDGIDIGITKDPDKYIGKSLGAVFERLQRDSSRLVNGG